jgi:4-amino-4-deoxy-L-arabinose transferase-like glycosyltransferase
MRTPEFFRIFFLQHNLARFGSNLYRHRQPFWYYLPVALVASMPWTPWVFHGLGDAVAGLRRRDDGTGKPYTFEIFLLLWAAVPIAFFSLSRSKLPGYILPSMPALLMLAAVAIHRRAGRGEGPRWTTIAAQATLMSALAALTCSAPHLIFKTPLTPAGLMTAAMAGTAVFLITALPLLTWEWRLLRFVTLLPMILMVGFVLRGLAPALDATQSARPVAAVIGQLGQGELPVASFGLNRNSAFGLAFYLNRGVDPYEGLEISPGVEELAPGVPAGAHLLVAREGSLPSLRLLLAGRSLRLLGSYAPQHIELFQVSPVDEAGGR